jgi:hypothetical protein
MKKKYVSDEMLSQLITFKHSYIVLTTSRDVLVLPELPKAFKAQLWVHARYLPPTYV